MKKLNKELTTKLDDLRGELDAAWQKAQDYFDEKSEKWRDSEYGFAYAAWMEQILELCNALKNLPYSPRE
jgi:hypothetical protein